MSQIKINISLLNIQSVGKKSHLIQDYVSDSGADIIFLAETWLKEKGDEVKISTMTPSGYKCKSFPRRSGAGGGICLFFRDFFE